MYAQNVFFYTFVDKVNKLAGKVFYYIKTSIHCAAFSNNMQQG